MRIDRIVLNNFISHQSTDTPFYDGITMIIGHNGAGKSSIIDAIVFALFGPKGEYVRGKKAEDLIKKGKMFASVELHFSMGENRYTVFRRVSMKKSDTAAYLEMNGNRIIDTISGVDQEIESILGVSKEIFMNSVFVKQGEMDSLIDEDPAKRKELFGKLIGIDRLTRSSKTVGDLVKDLENEKAVLQESVKNIEPLKDSLKEAEGQKKVQSENLVVISSDLAEARKFLSSVEEKRTIILGKQSELNSARLDLERINSEITATEDKLKRTMIEISRLEGLLKAQETLANDPLLVNRESISRYFVIQGRFQSTRRNLKRRGRISRIYWR
jgi:ATPase involved in DNA repair